MAASAKSVEDWTGYRLPTEKEWEQAALAGDDEVGRDTLAEIAWFRQNSEGMTHQVSLKAANQWGLRDVFGNVWEWTGDCYRPRWMMAATSSLTT